jgi:hypothetical protein
MGGWTHEQYLEEPYAKLLSIRAMMREEAEESNRRAKQS